MIRTLITTILFAGFIAGMYNPLKVQAAGRSRNLSVEFKTDSCFVVSPEGKADFKTVQAAIDAAPSFSDKKFVIKIRQGVYREVVHLPAEKTNIFFKGDGPDKTVLSFDNYAKRLNPDGKEFGTSGSATVFIKGNGFLAQDITFENSAGMNAGQALAINITAATAAFKNCRFLGYQDTYFAANGTRQYLKDCYLEGSVDFIFGGSTAAFESCTIRSLRGGYITAASTPQDQRYGYVFFDCKILGKDDLKPASVYLGRPWRPYASVTFINCDLGAHIRPEGWHNWGNPANEKTARYTEFNSSGAGYQQGRRHLWTKQLSAQEAEHFTIENVLGAWTPFK